MELEKLTALATAVDEEDRELVQDVLTNAGWYVAAVTAMEAASRNIIGAKGEEYRQNIESTDAARTRAHNAFIASVDLANKLADFAGVERIYTGSSERREYGDYAMRLVSEIFAARQ